MFLSRKHSSHVKEVMAGPIMQWLKAVARHVEGLLLSQPLTTLNINALQVCNLHLYQWRQTKSTGQGLMDTGQLSGDFATEFVVLLESQGLKLII